MSIKYERLDFNPDTGVQEAINRNFVRPFPTRRHNVAENIDENLQGSEQLIQLNKYQGNLGLMGTVKTGKVTKKGVDPNYRAFFIAHPALQEVADLWSLLVERYKSVLNGFLGVPDCSDTKAIKAALKGLEKKDPKNALVEFLQDLKPFPKQNTLEISAAALEVFNGLFGKFVESEGNVYQCPYDGKPMVEMYEDKYGIKFCSEKCKKRYSFLMFNLSLKETYEMQFMYPSRLVGNAEYEATPLHYPNICFLCGHVQDYPHSQIARADTVYHQKTETGRGINSRVYHKYFHIYWALPYCADCRELLSDLEMSGKGIRYDVKARTLHGFPINDLEKMGDLYIEKTIGWIHIETKNKFLAWELLAYNHNFCMPKKIQNLLVAAGKIDPDCPFEWLTHRYLKYWTDLFASMLQKAPPIGAAEMQSLFATLQHLM